MRISPYYASYVYEDTICKEMISRHHYSRRYPAAIRRVGMYDNENRLLGVAVFCLCMPAFVSSCFFRYDLYGEMNSTTVLELGRLVLLPEAPANAASWLLSRAFKALHAEGYQGIISLADPIPRTDLQGITVFSGHAGKIYQALNGCYIGKGGKRTLRLLPDGTVFSARAWQRVRAKERGWQASVDLLVGYGAPRMEDENTREWLKRVIPMITRPLYHTGNHRYIWHLDPRKHKDLLHGSLPYP